MELDPFDRLILVLDEITDHYTSAQTAEKLLADGWVRLPDADLGAMIDLLQAMTRFRLYPSSIEDLLRAGFPSYKDVH